MTNFEIFLVVLICAVPFIAFFMVLPKKLNKKEEKVEHVKTLAEVKAEEKKPETAVEEKVIEQPKQVSKSEISTDDFKNYLNRRKPISKPNRMELPDGFVDMTSPYLPRRRKRDENPKTVAEEIQKMSPKLKALIISGVLEPKDFDKM